jgi:phosphoenolpyruvate synthase/pyruvate phosphate dikinase
LNNLKRINCDRFDCFLDNDKEITVSKIGNKAYNLLYFWKNYPEINIPKSIILQTDWTKDTDVFAEFISIKYPVIARSSSTVEDSNISFAGLFSSYVCICYEELLEAVTNIKNGIYSEHVLKYCLLSNIDAQSIRMAVLIQEFIKPQVSGVTFTENPLTKDKNVIYTEYFEDSSDAVTSGTITPKHYVLQKKIIHEDDDLFGVRKISLMAEEFLKCSADIEWIISDNKLIIVQLRPVSKKIKVRGENVENK